MNATAEHDPRSAGRARVKAELENAERLGKFDALVEALESSLRLGDGISASRYCEYKELVADCRALQGGGK